MKACWSLLFACAALAAGAFATDALVPLETVTPTAGSDLPTRVLTNMDEVESCFLVSPKGESIQFIPEDTSSDKYELQPPIVLFGCQVTIKNLVEDDSGTWELYYTTHGEKRGSQYYDVTVTSQGVVDPVTGAEEEVKALPSIVTIAQGSDLHVRLENPTTLHDSCALIGPTRSTADRDDNFVDTCGFIVRAVTLADAGVWEITYEENGTKYRAFTRVEVTERFVLNENNLVWLKNSPLNETVGPEDTVFCKVEDPSGLTVFEGFGRCNILLDRVRSDHAGVWKAAIATTGRVLADTYEFTVTVAAASKPEVVTTVVSEKPSVMLTCQVATEHEVTACKFRDPSGKVLLASQGVGEDRYSFHGQDVSLHTEVTSHECGLRITDPVVADLGLWRCAVETEADTYYGFLSVLCPWALSNPEIDAVVVTEPILTAEVESMTAVEGDMVTMRCSVQSAIRYCYFRKQNGTIYNVNPGSSEGYSYPGAGFDSGECSIRFPALQASDSGRWSCHVGFNDTAEPEQQATIQLLVEEQMVADQYHVDGHDTLVVHGQVHSRHSLEYCRFVRMDGHGFTSQNLPSGYEDHSFLNLGICEIRISNPNILEQHPWVVVAKIEGHDSELARTTQHTLTIPGAHGEENEEVHVPPPNSGANFMVIWTSLLTIALALSLVGIMLIPKRNRRWTYQRATHLRDSFRSGQVKKPLPPDTNAQCVQGTQMPA